MACTSVSTLWCAVQIGPARLHHADLGIGEMMHGALQKIARRNEIGVEDGDHFAGGGFQPVFKRASLVSVAIGPVDVLDGQAGSRDTRGPVLR